jgi:hypothetical protein
MVQQPRRQPSAEMGYFISMEKIKKNIKIANRLKPGTSEIRQARYS